MSCLAALHHFHDAEKARAARRWPKAIAAYRSALALNPAHRPAANNLAWLLATCPDPRHRDGKAAVALMQWAAAPDVTTWQYVGTLAAACAEAGDFDAALRHATRAQQLAAGTDEGRWTRWLATLSQHKPLRDVEELKNKADFK
jgi:Flp pilus assembly protein TadD